MFPDDDFYKKSKEISTGRQHEVAEELGR